MADLQACLDALEAVSTKIEQGQIEVRTAITTQSGLIDWVAREVSVVKQQLAEKVNDVQADLGSTPAPACGFCPGDATQHQRRYNSEKVDVLQALTERSAKPTHPELEEVVALECQRSKAALAQPLSEVDGDTEEEGEEYTRRVNVTRFSGFWKDEVGEEFAQEWNIKSALGFELADKKILRAGTMQDKNPTSPTAAPDAISSAAKLRKEAEMNAFQRFVTSTYFDQLSGVLILIHSFSVGMEANERAMDPLNACGGPWVMAQLICNIIFTVELLVRMASFGMHTYFCGSDRYWNYFDLLVISGGIMEEIIQAIISTCERDADSSQIMTMFTMLRILRILRMTRLIRAVRFMNIFRELRVMVQSVLGCLIPLCWCIVLLFFIQWCFAIYFITVTADAVQGIHLHPERYVGVNTESIKLQIDEYFGSLWSVLYVLFLTTSGGIDWAVVAAVFVDLENYIAVLGFLFYVALVAMAVLNVVTAVFVEYAMKMAADDRDLVIQDYIDKESKFSKDAAAVFQEADLDANGSITFDEFTQHLEDLRVQAFLRSMELDGIEAVRLFKLLDADGNGAIEIDEFVQGCMCLRGNAKTLDLAMLLWEQRKAMRRWMSFMSYVDVKLNEITKQRAPVFHAGSKKAAS